MSKLIQLIYLSSSEHLLMDDELHHLLKLAREKNVQHQITGLLLYNEGNFIQVIEGEREEVTQLYRNICGDPMHKGLIKLIEQDIEQRDFPHWAMSFRDLSALGEKGFSNYMLDNDMSEHNTIVSEVTTLLMRFKRSYL